MFCSICNTLLLALGVGRRQAAGEGLVRRPSPGLRARLSRRESEILSSTLSTVACPDTASFSRLGRGANQE